MGPTGCGRLWRWRGRAGGRGRSQQWRHPSGEGARARRRGCRTLGSGADRSLSPRCSPTPPPQSAPVAPSGLSLMGYKITNTLLYIAFCTPGLSERKLPFAIPVPQGQAWRLTTVLFHKSKFNACASLAGLSLVVLFAQRARVWLDGLLTAGQGREFHSCSSG
jgi:hypothetical protein